MPRKLNSQSAKFALSLILLVFFLATQSGNAACAAGWINNVQVTKVKLVSSANYLAIQISPAHPQCGDWFVYHWAFSGKSYENAKSIMSIASTAQSTGTVVGIKTDGTLQGGWSFELSDIGLGKTGAEPGD